MRFCVNCGNELTENAKFCTRCGCAVETEKAVTNSTENLKKAIPPENANKKKQGLAERVCNSEFASIAAILFLICGACPLTRTDLGFWSGENNTLTFGIVFGIAGIITIILILLKAKILYIIPAIIALLGALFMKTILGLYGSLIKYTIWYYLIYVGIILLIVQVFIKRDFKIKNLIEYVKRSK